MRAPSFDPEHTVIRPRPTPPTGGHLQGRHRDPCRETRHVVGGQDPDRVRPDGVGHQRRHGRFHRPVGVWNMVDRRRVPVVRFQPAEVMRYVHLEFGGQHPGTGMGGGTSMQTMYHGNLLGRNKPNDIFQESCRILPRTVQSYVAGGAMIHPVAACATAAVSVEEGVDKIRLRAQLVVRRPDDLTLEGIIGFGDMGRHRRHVHDVRPRHPRLRKFSRPRTAAVWASSKAQGGGTILLARGDLAPRMGLPVLAVVAFAQSFGDGVHTRSRPRAWALGAAVAAGFIVGAGAGCWGVAADDVAVISKHDTSTLANDPNETERYERRLADALGHLRAPPLFVVSQKSDRPRQGRRGGSPDDGALPDIAGWGDPTQPQPRLRR